MSAASKYDLKSIGALVAGAGTTIPGFSIFLDKDLLPPQFVASGVIVSVFGAVTLIVIQSGENLASIKAWKVFALLSASVLCLLAYTFVFSLTTVSALRHPHPVQAGFGLQQWSLTGPGSAVYKKPFGVIRTPSDLMFEANGWASTDKSAHVWTLWSIYAVTLILTVLLLASAVSWAYAFGLLSKWLRLRAAIKHE